MFGRWRKQKEEGVECPLCGMNSPEGTPECPRCYYQLEKGILEQDEQEVTERADGLFDELNSEDAEEEEEELVDWTSHSFGVDEVTIDVSQYDDSESVNIDAAPGFASYGKAQPELADHPEPTEDDPADWELAPEDAPKEVERFVVPQEQEVQQAEEIPDFQVDLVVPLLPEQSENDVDVDDDSAPLHDPSAVPDEEPDEQQSESTTSTDAAPVEDTPPELEAVVEPVEPTPAPSSLPQLPSRPVESINGAEVSTPKLPSLPGTGEAVTAPVVPTLPSQPNPPPPADVFEEKSDPQTEDDHPESDEQIAAVEADALSDRLWPWPQADEWDDLTVRRLLREVMEQVKSGSLDAAARDLDKLGPHIGERVELIFHVGVVLKKLEQDTALARMLETGQRLYPDDENVANAVNTLGS